MYQSFLTILYQSIFLKPFARTKGGGGQAQWSGCQISDQGVPGSSTGRCTVCCGLEQVAFTPCLVLVKPRNRLGQTVTRLETTLWLMSSVQGPDNMDKTVPHTFARNLGCQLQHCLGIPTFRNFMVYMRKEDS